MTRLVFFTLLLAVSTGYSLWRGDRDSRRAALICLVATAFSRFLAEPVLHRFASLEMGVLAVDLATLTGFILIALSSSRFWPLWLAGLQLTAVVGHALKAVEWSLLPRAYGAALVFWSYPILLLLMIGAWRAHRRRLAERAIDCALA